jgi:glucosamine-phosphate N-acetyltransferase
MIKKIREIILNEKNFNEISRLYSHFGDMNNLNFIALKNIVERMPENQNIYFYINNETNEIIGAITLIIEQKLIHNGAKAGHIEDLVVLDKYRSCGIGGVLLEYVIQLARDNNCYKVILDCDDTLEKYYIKKGFVKKGKYMGYYF